MRCCLITALSDSQDEMASEPNKTYALYYSSVDEMLMQVQGLVDVICTEARSPPPHAHTLDHDRTRCY